MAFDFTQARSRLFNRPLLVTPDRAQTLAAVLAARAGWHGEIVIGASGAVTGLRDLAATAQAMTEPEAHVGGDPDRRPYPVNAGIATVEVMGTLVAKLGTMDPWSGMTGYDGLIAKTRAAGQDPEVRGVLLDAETPGGEVHSSLQELVAVVREVRDAKPVWAACSDYAYSAGFWLASACDRIIVPPTGGVGSAGVVCLHADFSKAMDDMGVRITLIHAGAHKVDGNPYEPLPKQVRQQIQDEIEAIRLLFAADVAMGLEMPVDAVQATEARCYMGQAAVDIGFADAVMTPEQAMTAFAAHLDGDPVQPRAAQAAINTQPEKEGLPMSAQKPKTSTTKPTAADTPPEDDEAKPDGNAAADKPEDDEEKPDGNAAADKPEDDEEKPDGNAAADKPEDDEEKPDGEDDDEKSAAAERKRIAAILDAPEAQGREALAKHLAFSTRMTPAEATKALAKASKGGGLAAAMGATGDTDVGDTAPEGRKASGWADASKRVFGSSPDDR